MHRRMFFAGCASMLVPASARSQDRRRPVSAQITVDRFDPPGSAPRSAVILLHGSDGLSYSGRYASAARMIASAGYTVFLPHYFESTGDRRAAYSEIGSKFPAWLAAIGGVLDQVSDDRSVVRNRVGVVGISLGGALALALSAQDPRVKAVVNYFGYLPGQLRAARRFAPTLILHGDADRIVPVANADAIESLLRMRGVTAEKKIYAGEGHGFGGAASSDAAARTAAFLGRYVG